MSLLNVLRAGVAVANAVTKPLQTTVQYSRTTGASAYGATYAPAVEMTALVEQKQRQVKTSSGLLETSTSTLTFLDIAKLVKVTQGNGISDSDGISLPDNSGGSILAVGGFVDAGTGRPLATEVYLG